MSPLETIVILSLSCCSTYHFNISVLAIPHIIIFVFVFFLALLDIFNTKSNNTPDGITWLFVTVIREM